MQSIKLWNQLPEGIKKLRSVYNFSTRIKCELLCENINFPTLIKFLIKPPYQWCYAMVI